MIFAKCFESIKLCLNTLGAGINGNFHSYRPIVFVCMNDNDSLYAMKTPVMSDLFQRLAVMIWKSLGNNKMVYIILYNIRVFTICISLKFHCMWS